MEQETLFTASKWEILKLLESGPSSPIELASLSRTSVANVSQQLRLLELAGLVTSQRVSNREKGQPRVLYSLAGNHCYVISTANDFVDKKLHTMSIHNKVIMRIWFSASEQERYFLEKAFWSIEHLLPKLDGLSFSIKNNVLRFQLISQNISQLPKFKTKDELLSSSGIACTVHFEACTPELASSDFRVIYDPKNLLGGSME